MLRFIVKYPSNFHLLRYGSAPPPQKKTEKSEINPTPQYLKVESTKLIVNMKSLLKSRELLNLIKTLPYSKENIQGDR